MAIDRWMHQQLLAGGAPMLRLYRWSRPTLSLGRHQQRWPEHWQVLADAGLIELVRRPSGGRAVLHAGDLTYALVMRAPDRSRAQSYRQACSWLRQAFGAAGEPLHFGHAAAASAQQRSNCFATATAADLVDPRGAKRIGSAQLWQGTALLQHGSLLLEPPSQLWRAVFAEPPPELAALPWDGDQLEHQLRRAAEAHLCMAPLLEQPLSSDEWAAVQALEAACMPDQASPLASIERATGASPMPSG
ncbi:MAG: lipoate--protein ligase family protein [Cyanobacteria bacterium M_surface_10_m2_179]|nr:lipoate--protein ligase family protein [Cyanobacteria bacterium M_surface_10_m2_179]